MTVQLFLDEWRNDATTVRVCTSGSTGTPKEMWVEKRRMEASARTTCRFLGLKKGDTALLCLPMDFIAGKMMAVRAEVCGLRLTCIEPCGHPLAEAGGEGFDFAAMVPMQVYNSLQVAEERRRLAMIRHLIIGGGAIDETLERELQCFHNAIWSTYGMTETLSHIALRRVSQAADDGGWYTPFEGVATSLSPEGCLVIDAPEVCPATLVTNDMAQLHADGRFRILGRRDNVICSGGLKIQIEEVERMLHPHIPFPFMITRRRDPSLGEAVVMLMQDGDEEVARRICASVLPRHYRPRHYANMAALPTTATGKPARAQAEQAAMQAP